MILRTSEAVLPRPTRHAPRLSQERHAWLYISAWDAESSYRFLAVIPFDDAVPGLSEGIRAGCSPAPDPQKRQGRQAHDQKQYPLH
jgi:hypothetical protein